MKTFETIGSEFSIDRKNYPENVINFGIEKATTLTLENLRTVRIQKEQNENSVCLVTTYNPNNPSAFKVVKPRSSCEIYTRKNTDYTQPKTTQKLEALAHKIVLLVKRG